MRNRVLLPYLILLLGFCFTLLVYYYFYKLTYEQDRIRFNSSVQEIQDQVRIVLETGVRDGGFVVPDVPGTALALLSLVVDVARWYRPDGPRSPEEIGALYADLALRMVSAPR